MQSDMTPAGQRSRGTPPETRPGMNIPDDTTSRPLRVVLCEDHSFMLQATRQNIERELDWEVVGEAVSGEAGLALVERLRPDILVLDLLLPGQLNGWGVLAEIRKRQLPVRVFIFTGYCDPASFEDRVNRPDGPDGIMEKQGDIHAFIYGLREVAAGRKFVPQSLWPGQHRIKLNPLSALSASEFRQIELLAQGKTYREISGILNKAPSTLRDYMTGIYDKLGLEQRSIQSAVRFFNEHAR